MSWTNGPMSDHSKPINLWSRASHWSSVFCTAARGVKVQLIRTRRVEPRCADHPYHIRGLKWKRAELAGPTWTIKPALTEDVPSWLVRLEQSNQRWLKTCRAGWFDFEQSKWNGLSMPVHSPPSVKPVKAQTLVLRSNEPYQSTVHQASSLLRRRRLFSCSIEPYKSTVHQTSSLLRRRHLFSVRTIPVDSPPASGAGVLLMSTSPLTLHLLCLVTSL